MEVIVEEGDEIRGDEDDNDSVGDEVEGVVFLLDEIPHCSVETVTFGLLFWLAILLLDEAREDLLQVVGVSVLLFRHPELDLEYVQDVKEILQGDFLVVVYVQDLAN